MADPATKPKLHYIRDIAHVPAASKHTRKRAKALAEDPRPYDADILAQPVMNLDLSFTIGERFGVKARVISARSSMLDVPYDRIGILNDAAEPVKREQNIESPPPYIPSRYNNSGYDNRLFKVPELFWPIVVMVGGPLVLLIFIYSAFGEPRHEESRTTKVARELCAELRDCH